MLLVVLMVIMLVVMTVKMVARLVLMANDAGSNHDSDAVDSHYSIMMVMVTVMMRL